MSEEKTELQKLKDRKEEVIKKINDSLGLVHLQEESENEDD